MAYGCHLGPVSQRLHKFPREHHQPGNHVFKHTAGDIADLKNNRQISQHKLPFPLLFYPLTKQNTTPYPSTPKDKPPLGSFLRYPSLLLYLYLLSFEHCLQVSTITDAPLLVYLLIWTSGFRTPGHISTSMSNTDRLIHSFIFPSLQSAVMPQN